MIKSIHNNRFQFNLHFPNPKPIQVPILIKLNQTIKLKINKTEIKNLKFMSEPECY